MPAQSVSSNLEGLAAGSRTHVDELTELGFYYLTGDLAAVREPAPRLEVKTVKYVNFDGRRYWKLATVWLDGKPVMITQNAGREGDDCCRRFITDLELFKELLAYVISLLPKRLDYEQAEKDCVAPEAPRDDLTCFYGHKLETVAPTSFY